MVPDTTFPPDGRSASSASGDQFDDIMGDLLTNADAGDSAPRPSPSASGGASPQAGAAMPDGAAKVELDIEDAPFLEEEEEKPAPPPPAEKKPLPERPLDETKESQPPGGLKGLLQNKKRLALAAAALVLILLSPLAYLFLTGKKEPEVVQAPPPPPPQEAPQEPRPERLFVYESAPYLVERRGSEGELRFLRLRFTISTNSEGLFREIQTKKIILRDAVYYYLSNKALEVLNDKKQMDLLRSDLISVINEHVSADKVTELYFEEYLVSGPSR